jgi:hypothetical protein
LENSKVFNFFWKQTLRQISACGMFIGKCQWDHTSGREEKRKKKCMAEGEIQELGSPVTT